MTLRLYPLPSLFDDDVALVKSQTPVNTSSFYLRRPHSVPWSVLPTTFILETDEPDAVHEFVINNTEHKRIVPGANVISLQFQLTKGANRIDVHTPTIDTYITIAATAIETWFRALGREFYLSVGRRLADIEAHFNTPWTTRVSAHLIPYSDLFLPARMPKIQQTRFAILTSTGERLGYGDGVLTVASAVSYCTPYVSKARDAEFCLPERDFLYPGVTTHPTTGEFRGRVLDLWYPNQCLAAKEALYRLALNLGAPDVPDPKPLSLVDVDDIQVLLSVNGGETEVHILDPLSFGCADIEAGTDCERVRVFADFETLFDVMMTTPQLPFDEVVENPLNFGFFDSGYNFDASTGSGELGLGGGDSFDNVDEDDPFGDGFAGYSLTGRLDSGACMDTRIQFGQAMAKFVPPLAGLSHLTPGEDQTGTPLTIDAKAGAPAPTLGASVFWGVSPRTFLYEGDVVRFEEPDAEIAIVSAWPVFDVNKIVKSSSSGTNTSVNASKRQIGAPAGFFEQKHKGMGIRVAGSALYSIVSVSDDGTTAIIAGNPAALPGGSFIINVYEPLRDRSVTLGAPFAGARTYEITLATTLLANYTDGTVIDYRPVPRVSGAYGGGVATFNFSSNVKPVSSDFLYIDPLTEMEMDSVIETGAFHPTTGMPIYQAHFTTTTGGPLTEGEALYAIHANPCFPHGDPITPLTLISFSPPAYLTP